MNAKPLCRRVLTTALATLLASPLFAADPAAGRMHNLRAIEQGAEFSGFIVKFREGSAERRDVRFAQRAVAAASQRAERLMPAGQAKRGGAAEAALLTASRRTFNGADVVRPGRRLGANEARVVMQQLASLPGVEYVEPDLILRPALTPNDTFYAFQWGFFDADAGIRADQAWDLNTGAGQIVAVIDTGLTDHADLNANMLYSVSGGTGVGYDFISNATTANDGGGRDSNPSDPGDWDQGACGTGAPSSWHGTHVSGTVAAVTNNATGVAGTAFGAKVLPVRALGTCGGSLSDIADAVEWSSGGTVAGVTSLGAADVADVLNLSLGGTGACSGTMQTAINNAVSRGVSVVVAAGNSSADVSGFTPANCSNVIAVASVDEFSTRSGFSNYGALIDVAAPGTDIASTVDSGVTVPTGANYNYKSGTSMAAPHVAGTVALVQGYLVAQGKTPLTPAAMEGLLKSTAYAPAGSCVGCGSGIINAYAAMTTALAQANAPTVFSNNSDYAIRDLQTTNAPINVTGRSGNASASLKVAVRIIHPYIGDLRVDLVAPNGAIFNLHNRTGGGADNIIRTYTVNASSVPQANGTWWLRIRDNVAGDSGYLDSWSLTF